MSLRIEPVLTQACYIIGCSEKLKNVSETRWVWNVPLFINTFFFFFFTFVLVPIPKYSATEICWRRCEKGQKSLLAFPEGVSAATVPKALTYMAGAASSSQPICVACERVSGGVCTGPGEGLLWTWPQVITGFLSLELWKLSLSKLPAASAPFLIIQMTVIDVLLTGSGSLGERIAQSTSYPDTPSLPHIWRKKKTGVFGLEVETFFFFPNK